MIVICFVVMDVQAFINISPFKAGCMHASQPVV